jgi:hypothetical protein
MYVKMQYNIDKIQNGDIRCSTKVLLYMLHLLIMKS